ncbi:MAG: zinc-binding dehydrogenase [Candidatus Eremiobacteraeota bacterium]|nr:zinc-binding dehydrogenase [Candidatus Eremiobacteraeota bacterium]
MRAAYLVAPGRLEIRDEAIPVPEPGGVVVRIRVALTDGTDLKAFRRGHPQMPMPTRFGHEFSGDVAAVGAGVRAFACGDAIMSVHSAPDGTCFWCARGQENLCESVMTTKILGAYAQYVAVPRHIVERNAFHKPPGLSYEAAAFLEPVACVVHSLQTLAARTGDDVAIIGDGGFGLLHALAARALGLRPILVGRRAERLALARSLGVERTLNAGEVDVRAALAELTAGRGPDAVIESTGAVEVWEAAPSYVRRGGTVVLFGGLPTGTRAAFEAALLHYDEIRLLSPFHFTPRAVRAAHDALVSHALDVEPLIGRRFELERLDDAFAALASADGPNLKFAILP